MARRTLASSSASLLRFDGRASSSAVHTSKQKHNVSCFQTNAESFRRRAYALLCDEAGRFPMWRVDGRAFESADAAAGSSSDKLCCTDAAASPGVLASVVVDATPSTRALTASAPSPAAAGTAAGISSASTTSAAAKLATSAPASASAATLGSIVSILGDLESAASAAISLVGKSTGVLATAPEATLRAASAVISSATEGRAAPAEEPRCSAGALPSATGGAASTVTDGGVGALADVLPSSPFGAAVGDSAGVFSSAAGGTADEDEEADVTSPAAEGALADPSLGGCRGPVSRIFMKFILRV